MPPMIPLSLQAKRPSKPLTVEDYQFIKRGTTKEAEAERSKIEEINTKLKDVKTPEEYSSIYSSIPTDLKKYFTEPTEITKQLEQERQGVIDKNVSDVSQRIKTYQEKIEQQNKSIQEAYDYYKRKSEQFPNRETQLRKDFEEEKERRQEKIKEYDYQVKFSQEGIGYISQGYELGGVYNYVDSKVNYYMAKSEARKQAEKSYQEATKLLEGKYITPSGFITPYKPKGD